MDELFKLLMIHGIGTFPSREIVKLTLYSSFEPCGKAIEDWDFVWKIEFPNIVSYWYNAHDGKWKPRPKAGYMVIKGCTYYNTVNKAIDFLKKVDNLQFIL